ncbi:hypothetical protein [Streptomyces sp. KL116D]|uniref:hypothetical protein n=1 Tax=Streptomyces sp. KL116D TaxID=3045152 RepID=UPI003556E742
MPGRLPDERQVRDVDPSRTPSVSSIQVPPSSESIAQIHGDPRRFEGGGGWC